MGEHHEIRGQGLAKTFAVGRHEIQALAPTTIQVESGETLAVVGESGIGKTTLLKILALALAPSEGVVSIDGEPAPRVPSPAASRARATFFGVVYQDLLLDERLTAHENIELPLGARQRSGEDKRHAEVWIRELAELFRISHRLDFPVSLLSGGERQRVAMARAMVTKPPFLILDEPTASLDTANAEIVVGGVKELAERGHGIIVATHADHFAHVATRQLSLACEK